ncbi:SagB family peptide dehydrogenase [Bradyrhizobium japonicum]|uniref:SagB family peptide dehydrogenase n=1 Tax=Bradyrhizobium japonicum TaxID=375 RepID=UPI0035E2685A
MTSGTTLWSYALAPDVEVCPTDGGAFVHTATCQIWVEATELKLLELLAAPGHSEEDIYDRLGDQPGQSNPDGDLRKRCAALLFRLDRLGLLIRGLSSQGRRLVSCIPLRPPPGATPKCSLEGVLRLSPSALARVDQGAISLEAPGSWVKMSLHDRSLLPLLHDLAIGLPAAEITKAKAEHCEQTILAILGLMSQCGLLERSEQDAWSGHDLFFHTRTRRGYARTLLGKSTLEGQSDHQFRTTAIANDERRLVLEPPLLSSLFATDPPYAAVSARRQSMRRQGSIALTSGQLSEFLFRTLCDHGGRRPYPSGGASYPLQTYLAVNRCRGVAPGLYAYEATAHELIAVGGPGLQLERLLADAAGTANVDEPPQILLVLTADYRRMRRLYEDLSYSLILKEVGAVFQVAMMAAAAMGLGTCPLGCGDSLLFSELIGVDPTIETSVGELMLGSLE